MIVNLFTTLNCEASRYISSIQNSAATFKPPIKKLEKNKNEKRKNKIIKNQNNKEFWRNRLTCESSALQPVVECLLCRKMYCVRTFLAFMENQICKRTQCPYQEKVQCDLQRNELFTKRN